MRYLMLVLITSVCAGASDKCAVVDKSISQAVGGKSDTTAIVQSGTSILTCMDQGQLRILMQVSEERRVMILRRDTTIALQSAIILELDSAYKAMVGVDHKMQQQVDTLRKVISIADTIQGDMKQIRALTEGQLARCEESKLTLMEKITFSLGIFLVGGLAGVLAF